MSTPIKDLVAGGLDGLLNGASKIIANFKADPTEVLKAQSELEKLRIEAQNKALEISVQIEAEKTKQIESENKAITDRWSSDMASDSTLSKNTRPIGFLSTLAFLFLLITFDSLNIDFDVKDEYISLMEILLITIVGAYYGGRTLEKYQTIRMNK